jgi:hypothetical protein
MTRSTSFVGLAAVLFTFGVGAANAGTTIEESGALTCVTDKWDETEPDKGHKLVDAAMRCVFIPKEGSAGEMGSQDCVGKYEYMPDESWKGSGTCSNSYKTGDKVYESWEEGSALKDAYTYKVTGGTGKYEGASGGGTYFYENLTDTLAGGTYKGTIQLP